MKIGIIGAGSLGLLIAGYLGKQHDVYLYTKKRKSGKNNSSLDVCIYDNGKNKTSTKVSLVSGDLSSNLDCYFICVKQPQLRSVLLDIVHIQDTIPIVFIQNGMGHLEMLQQLNHPVYVGIVEHGAKKITEFHVDHLGKGNITIGTIKNGNDHCDSFITELNQPNFPIIGTQDIMPIMKNKLIINSVINPLTALFCVPNKEIINNPHIHNIAIELCNEATTVLGLDKQLVWNKIKQIALNTGENTSSMLQDILLNRETEIKAISGYLLSKTEVNLPYTSFVYEAILALEGKEKYTWGK